MHFILVFGIPSIGFLGLFGHCIDHGTCSWLPQAAHVTGNGEVHFIVGCDPWHFRHLMFVVHCSVVWVNEAHLEQGTGIGLGGLLG